MVPSKSSALAVEASAQPSAAVVGPGKSRPRKGSVRFTSNIVGSLHMVADLICFLLAAPIAVFAYSEISGREVVVPVHVFAFVLMLGSFLLIRSSRAAYRRSLLDPIEGPTDALFDAVISALIAAALVWQAGLIEEYSRGVTLLNLLTVSVLLACSRPLLGRVVDRLAANGRIEQRIVLFGATADSVRAIKRIIQDGQYRHLRLVGIADDRPRCDGVDDLPLIGSFADVCELARIGEVDQVLINGGMISPERIAQITDTLSSVSVDVSLVPHEAIALGSDYRVNLLGRVPVLTLWQRPFRDDGQLLKRAEDLFLSSLALVLLFPLLLLSALLIKLTSKGPVFFVQPRTGFNNELIHVIKFRTMYADAADLGARQTTVLGDVRITPVGKVLRKLSIDELPQLLNVLTGEMSLVGPRPHALEMKIEDLYYQDAVRGYAGRHRVKPGITGLAQVSGLRGELRTIERAKRRVELDQYYIENWSLLLDIQILLKTVWTVLFDRNAY